MKLSIITINYNNLEGLRKTIGSIVSQTWKDFEWIIIDGGSNDGSKELIEQTTTTCPNICFWCSEPDKGVYNAMNKGIAHAKGEYLNFMNSGDCFTENTTLAKVFAKEHTADIVYGDYLAIFHDHIDYRKLPNEATIPFLIAAWLCHQASFIRKDIFINSGYSEQFRIVSDWRQWLIWKKEGRVFEHIPLFVADFDMSGISATMNQQTIQERDIVIDEIFPREKMLVEDALDLFNYKMDISWALSYNPELLDTYHFIKKGVWHKRVVRYLLKLLMFFM